MPKKSSPLPPPVGLIGLGLMGRGIAACLVAHGFRVIAYNRTARRARESCAHIDEAVTGLAQRGFIPRVRAKRWRQRFQLVESIAELGPCRIVIESVIEDLALKRKLFAEVEKHVAPNAIIASNTSSFPITLLQAGRRHPGRYIGMHWGEPAQMMRYLEIIPGRHTTRSTVRRTRQFGEACGKEPTELREDIRGFLSNRMMYAMIREAFHLVESGVADIETVDKSFRNDMGWWSLLAGPFRWMDLTGIPAYARVMEGLLPRLSNSRKVPKLMRDVVASGAQGIGNAKGFYRYTNKEARRWEKDWLEFSYEIRRLADKFPRKR